MIGAAALGLAVGLAVAAGTEAPPPATRTPPLPPFPADPGVPPPLDTRRFQRGRRLSVAGLVLGWAGPGLVVSGGMISLTREPEGPLSARQLLVASTLGGVALGATGLGLQIVGGRTQARTLREADLPRQPHARAVALGLAIAGLVGGGVLAWRMAEPGPDGPWVGLTGPLAGAATLGATGLHTVALLEADFEVERLAVRVGATPSGLRLTGRW